MPRGPSLQRIVLAVRPRVDEAIVPLGTSRPIKGLVAVLSVALVLATSIQPATAVTPPETSLHELINAARSDSDLRPVRLSDRLSRIAHRHSRKMAASGTLFHSCLLCRIRVRHVATIGENVGVAASVPEAHQAFLASPNHRANVLGGAFRRAGVGVVRRGRRVWVTELFVGLG